MVEANLAAVAAEAARGTPAAEERKPAAAAAAEQKPERKPAATPAEPDAGQAAAAQQPAKPAVADLDSARTEGRAEGRAEALAYVAEVNDLCALAGQPSRAQAFIAQNTSVADVRKALLESRAAADEGRVIATQHGGAGAAAPQKGALAAGMKRIVGKKEG